MFMKILAGLAPRAILLTLAVFTVVTIVAGPAEASGNFAGHLPGKTWTTNGEYDPVLNEIIGEDRGGKGQVCVGPAQYSGGWKFPYGWDCSGFNQTVDSFPTLGGYAGVDNPSSAEVTFAVGYYG